MPLDALAVTAATTTTATAVATAIMAAVVAAAAAAASAVTIIPPIAAVEPRPTAMIPATLAITVGALDPRTPLAMAVATPAVAVAIAVPAASAAVVVLVVAVRADARVERALVSLGHLRRVINPLVQ